MNACHFFRSECLISLFVQGDETSTGIDRQKSRTVPSPSCTQIQYYYVLNAPELSLS